MKQRKEDISGRKKSRSALNVSNKIRTAHTGFDSTEITSVQVQWIEQGTEPRPECLGSTCVVKMLIINVDRLSKGLAVKKREKGDG